MSVQWTTSGDWDCFLCRFKNGGHVLEVRFTCAMATKKNESSLRFHEHRGLGRIFSSLGQKEDDECEGLKRISS